jgi:hypothetical protein
MAAKPVLPKRSEAMESPTVQQNEERCTGHAKKIFL